MSARVPATVTQTNLLPSKEPVKNPMMSSERFLLSGFFRDSCEAHLITRNGKKHPGDHSGKETGHYLAMNRLPEGLIVMDFDTPKDNPALIDAIHARFDDRMKDDLSRVVAVTTGRNGLHVYLRSDDSVKGLFDKKNNQIALFSVGGCSVDLFASGIRERQFGIMLPTSRVNDEKGNLTRRYDISHGTGCDTEITMTVSQFVKRMCFEKEYLEGISERLAVQKKIPDISETQSDERSSVIDTEVIDELKKIIVASGNSFTVHGNKNISAFLVCSCMNSLDKEAADRFLDTILYDETICTLTDHASVAMSRAYDTVIPFEALIKKIRSECGCPDDSASINLMITQKLADKKRHGISEETREKAAAIHIDVRDKTTSFDSVVNDYTHGRIITLDDCVLALKRVVAFIPGKVRSPCAVKFIVDGKVRVEMTFRSDLLQRLRESNPDGLSGKNMLVKTIEVESSGLLLSKGVRFHSDDPDYVSLFAGLPYDVDPICTPAWSAVDDLVMGNWVKLLGIICNGDDTQKKWLEAWIHKMITARNPDERPHKGIILYSDQKGTGKSTFCKILEELLGDDLAVELNGLERITGQYNGVIQNKLLVVANEISVKDDARGEERMKAAITDSKIEITEKYCPTVVMDNITSFIFVTNHKMAVPIRPGDRRLNIFEVSDEYGSVNGRDHEYWARFYEDYLAHRENILRTITRHYVREYPKIHSQKDIRAILSSITCTEARTECLSYRLSPVDRILVEHYEAFTNGTVDASVLKGIYNAQPKEYRDKKKISDFKREITSKCNTASDGRLSCVTIGQKQYRYYRLRPHLAIELKAHHEAAQRLAVVDLNDDTVTPPVTGAVTPPVTESLMALIDDIATK